MCRGDTRKSEKGNHLIKLFYSKVCAHNIWTVEKKQQHLERWTDSQIWEKSLELPNNKNTYLFPFRAIESTTSRTTLKVKPNSRMTSDNKEMYCNIPPIMLREDLPLFINSSPFNYNILRFVKQSTVGPFLSAVFQNGALKIAASFVAVAVVSFSSSGYVLFWALQIPWLSMSFSMTFSSFSKP